MSALFEIYIHSPIWLKTLMVLLPFLTPLAALKIVLDYRLAKGQGTDMHLPLVNTREGDEFLTIRSPEVARRLEDLATMYRYRRDGE